MVQVDLFQRKWRIAPLSLEWKLTSTLPEAIPITSSSIDRFALFAHFALFVVKTPE